MNYIEIEFFVGVRRHSAVEAELRVFGGWEERSALFHCHISYRHAGGFSFLAMKTFMKTFAMETAMKTDENGDDDF